MQILWNETVVAKNPTKFFSSTTYIELGLLLVASAALVLIPSYIALGNASSALQNYQQNYNGISDILQTAFNYALMQFVGFLLLFGFLGLGLFQLHEMQQPIN